MSAEYYDRLNAATAYFPSTNAIGQMDGEQGTAVDGDEVGDEVEEEMDAMDGEDEGENDGEEMEEEDDEVGDLDQ